MPHKKLVDSIRLFGSFTRGSAELILRGNRAYWTWLAFMGVLIVSGALAWSGQLQTGLGLTAMRDQVSWGFYIGNFTFLVGVAAAAVVERTASGTSGSRCASAVFHRATA